MLSWVALTPKHASAAEISLRILTICTLMLKSSCMHQYLMSNKDVSTLQYFWAGATGIMSTVFTQPHPWFMYCQDLRSHCFTPRRFVESVCGKKKNTSWVSEWKVRYKRETIGRQRNVTFWWVFSLTLQLSLPLFSVFSPLFFVLHSLLYCRSLQPSLMLIYAAWLAQHQQGGVLSLDYQQWKREGGEGWGMGGWGEGDLDRHLI